MTGPELAKVVVGDGVTAPVVTDGPFAEFKAPGGCHSASRSGYAG